jgi:hypothetical protein
MSQQDQGQTGAAEEQPAPRTTRWRVGTGIGIGGLVAFAVLGLVLVIGMFMPDSEIASFAVGLFPTALGALAVGILGIAVAGFRRPGSGDEDAA